jgi:hypothetical protein
MSTYLINSEYTLLTGHEIVSQRVSDPEGLIARLESNVWPLSPESGLPVPVLRLIEHMHSDDFKYHLIAFLDWQLQSVLVASKAPGTFSRKMATANKSSRKSQILDFMRTHCIGMTVDAAHAHVLNNWSSLKLGGDPPSRSSIHSYLKEI